MRPSPILLWTVLAIAPGALAQSGDLEANRTRLLAPDVDWNDRRQAARHVARHGDAAVEPLLAALDHPAHDVQLAARVGLVDLGEKALAALRARLAGGTVPQRVLAARALGDFGRAALGATADLDRILDGPEPDLAREARDALIRIGRAFEVPLDRIVRADGTEAVGIVLDEDDAWVTIDVVQDTESGRRVFQTRIARAKVARIVRTGAEQRPILRARIAAWRESGRDVRDLVRGIEVREDRTAGGVVRACDTEHFEVRSTAPTDFLREAAWRTEAMARAYEDAFLAPVQPGARVRVVLAGSLQEYQAIQEETFGTSILNPAFYLPAENAILGYTDIEAWRQEVDGASKAHRELTDAIESSQRELREARRRLKDEIEAFRAEAQEQARLRKKENRSLPSAKKREADRKVDEWLTEQLAKADTAEEGLRRREKDLQAELARDKSEIALLETKNRRLLDRVGEALFQTMAHEAFHAFFRNRIVLPENVGADVRWLDEGLAMYFESAAFDGVRLHPGLPNADWIRHLQSREKAGKLVSLGELFRGRQEDFVVHTEAQTDRSNLFYFQSWYLVRLLSEIGKLSDPIALRYYVAEIDVGVEPEEAFERLVLMKTRDVWDLYLTHLRADDGERYEWMTFSPGAGPPDAPRALARVVLRVNGKVHVRLRSGEVHVVGDDQVRPEGR